MMHASAARSPAKVDPRTQVVLLSFLQVASRFIASTSAADPLTPCAHYFFRLVAVPKMNCYSVMCGQIWVGIASLRLDRRQRQIAGCMFRGCAMELGGAVWGSVGILVRSLRRCGSLQNSAGLLEAHLPRPCGQYGAHYPPRSPRPCDHYGAH